MLKYHIQTVELTSAQSSISFNSIPQDFTDIYFSISGRTNQADNIGYSTFYVNNSTSNWSVRYLQGNSSAGASASTTSIPDFFMSGGNTTSNTFGNGTIYVSNYTAMLNKSISIDFVNENNATGAFSAMQRIIAALWSNAAPVTSAQFVANSGSNFLAGTSFSLYGVRRGSDGVVNYPATGGIVTTSGGYTIHTFNTSGDFLVNRNLQAEYLVIAGGGGGGGEASGGGGAGGYRSSVIGESSGGGTSAESTLSLTAGTNYPITVGAGGAGAAASSTRGSNGSNSIFNTITSIGGGGGGSYDALSGNSGGSGGGGDYAGGTSRNGAGTTGQGFAGGGAGAGGTGSDFEGGGGGGAGEAGGTDGQRTGGDGLSSSITGSSVTRAGGGSGGGGTALGIAAGGDGGGGIGARRNVSAATSGTTNTGSGGGGGDAPSTVSPKNGGAGGSGVVIIRYLTP